MVHGSSGLHLPFTQGIINAIWSSPPGVWTDDGGGILMAMRRVKLSHFALHANSYLPWAAGVGACMTHG